ncbi:MAG: glutathione S-transferase family protein [Rhodospirillales bacterium]
MPALTLVSHKLCPYVQRAAISLAEKHVAFARIDVDLSNKPDWFREISPLGKVPLLRVGLAETEEIIFESAVILEYLEDTLGNPLHPADPLMRARHRGWIEFASAMLNAIGRLYNAETEARFSEELEALSAMLDRLERELGRHPEGPLFAGDRFCLVDAAFAPVFRYFDTFEAMAALYLFEGVPLISAWRRQLATRSSVKAAVNPDYPTLLTDFLRRRETHISGLIAA